jgi:hypothetical protein
MKCFGSIVVLCIVCAFFVGQFVNVSAAGRNTIVLEALQVQSTAERTDTIRQFILKNAGQPGETFVDDSLSLSSQQSYFLKEQLSLKSYWTYNKIRLANKFRQFTGDQFRDVYENTNYIGVIQPSVGIIITGNSYIDQRIHDLAVSRGYRPRLVAQTDYLQTVGYGALHTSVLPDFIAMQDDAGRNGVNIGLASGYRSLDSQKKLFVDRLIQYKPIDVEIADYLSENNPYVDQNILSTLSLTAPPGYSRHHTGCTVDLSDASEGGVFRNTSAYSWLSANNFLNAKKFGFIPSYPEESSQQGPEPEPWEFVWVGRDRLVDLNIVGTPTELL